MKKNAEKVFRADGCLTKPNGRQAALLLLRLVEAKDKERERSKPDRARPMTRVRLAEITLKRLWNRQYLSQHFLDEVSDWLLSGGWALFFAGSTYAAVQIAAVENWPLVSSKRIKTEIEAVHSGKFNFDDLEHLFHRAARHAEEEIQDADD